MNSLFQVQASKTPFAASLLDESPAECRLRASQCRDLVDSCCTAEAAAILRDRAAELEARATNLESGHSRAFRFPH